MKHLYEYKGFEAIAHRGDSLHYTENTLSAFQAAADLGYRFMETDVQLTRDGDVVLMHDPTFERIAVDDSSPVAALTLSECRQIPLKKPGEITLLADALIHFPKAAFNIDLKTPSTIEPTLEVLDKLSAYERVCLGSFNTRTMRTVRQLRPSCLTAMDKWENIKLKFFAQIPKSVRVVQVPYQIGGVKIITRAFVKRCHRYHIKVHVWTVNDEALMTMLIKMGVDGIMTDNLRGLQRVLHCNFSASGNR